MLSKLNNCFENFDFERKQRRYLFKKFNKSALDSLNKIVEFVNKRGEYLQNLHKIEHRLQGTLNEVILDAVLPSVRRNKETFRKVFCDWAKIIKFLKLLRIFCDFK